MVDFSPKPVPRRKSELPPGIKSEPSYFDRNGNRYSSLNECIIGQIAIIIGQKRDGPEGQPNIAKLIANKAPELIPLLGSYVPDLPAEAPVHRNAQ